MKKKLQQQNSRNIHFMMTIPLSPYSQILSHFVDWEGGLKKANYFFSAGFFSTAVTTYYFCGGGACSW